MSLLIGAVTIGLILSLLALGVLISFRIFAFPDITAEGSITLGAAVAATLLVRGVNPWIATILAVFAGSIAGTMTGVLHTRFKINGLLSGILVMTALYSISLHVMSRSNIPLLSAKTFVTEAESILGRMLGGQQNVNVWGWEVSSRDASVLLVSLAIAAAVGAVLYIFLRTDLGTAIRATGDNSQMIRALGVNDGNMLVLGLAVSNGLIALAGALLSQYQGFSDVQMGIGMMVWGLASVIIGEALVAVKQLGLLITGAVMGSVLFRLLVAIALRWGLDPNDLKLITALFVFLALILPGLLEKTKKRKPSYA
jgi:putative tryptophan/tyrosine transport system permease protein